MVSDDEVKANARDEELLELIQEQYHDMLSNLNVWPQEGCISLDLVIGNEGRGGEARTRVDLFDEDGHMVETGKRHRR